MIKRIADRYQRLLGGFSLGLKLAVKIRNQCNRVVGYSVCLTPDATRNGEEWLLKSLVGKVEVFFDVGANRGDWTHRALDILKSPRRAVLFEPSKVMAGQLVTRFKDISGLDIINAAVGGEVGFGEFFESTVSSELSSLWSDKMERSGASRRVSLTTVETEASRLDIPRIDFLKIDTEGNDFFVLRGAANLLRAQAIGVIQFEYGSGWILSGSTLLCAVRFLESFGYSVFALKPEGLVKFQPAYLGEYFGYSNFVALSPDILHSFKLEKS